MLMIALWSMACTDTPPSTVPTATSTADTSTPTGSTGTTIPPVDTGAEPLDCSMPPSEDAAFYNLDNTLNPAHPTVAYARWCQRDAASVVVEYSFDEGEWHQAPAVDGIAGENARIVVGVPYGHAAQWRLVSGKTVVAASDPIVTPDAPEGLPIPEVIEGSQGFDPTERYLLTSISEDGGSWGSQGPYHTVIYDRQGRPVWTDVGLTGKRTLYAQVSVTGRTLLYDRFSGAAGSADAIAIRSYLDQEVERIPIEGHHHAFIELPDGTIAWMARNWPDPEQIMERAPGSDETREVWACDADWKEAPTCASNSMFYDVATEQYLVSHYITETVVVVDRTSGETQWWAGLGVPGGYEFVPAASQYWWQHGVFVTSAGTLMVSTHNRQSGETSNLGREYVIDHDKRELQLLFEFDAGVLAAFNGDIRRLPNGHTLISLGTGAVLKEVDETGADVWGLNFNADGVRTRLLGKSEFVNDLYRLTSSWEEPAPDATP